MAWQSDLRVNPPLRELRRALKDVDTALPKALNKVAKDGATIISSDARSRAGSVSPAAARAAGQIRPAGNAKGASVTLSASSRVPFALAALLGIDRRTGWYAQPKYDRSSERQAPPWIGTSWQVGGSGGPLAINPAFAAKSDELIQFLERELNALASTHFPD